LNDVSHPFVESSAAEKLAVDSIVLTCQVEEHVMVSVAAGYEAGRKRWVVTHESECGGRHLETHGELPEVYSSVCARLVAEQEKADAEAEPVDYIWDIPVTTAFEICGYRHDNMYLKSGEATSFTELVPA
jgi:hypothetical protein